MPQQLQDQKKLTEKYILPYASQIIEDVIRIRIEIIDEKLKNDPRILQLLSYWSKEYPIGLCAQIRNEMLDQIFNKANAEKYEGIKILMNFVMEGGKIIPFWGVDKDLYFENAILIGNAVLDVANDTVYTYKNPVEFYPDLETSPLKLISSFNKVAEIAEKYWHYEIYPNIYFPNLAPIFPLMAIVKTRNAKNEPVRGVIIMGDFVDLHPRNVHTISNGYACGLAYDFILNSAYTEKKLPEKILYNLKTYISSQNFEGIYKEIFRVSSDPKDVGNVFKELMLHKNDTDIPDHIMKKIKNMEVVGNKIKGVILATISE